MVNLTVIQGRLTKNPELRTTQSGVSVAGFTVTWSEKYKDAERTLFLPCVAWRNSAEFVHKYFTKGQEIVAVGQLITRKWTDKNGNNRETTELIVDNVNFCGPKQDSRPASEPEEHEELPEITDDDLPF